MYQQVSLTHLIKSGLERLHQLCWQLTDETDSIRQQKWKIINDNLTHSGIESGKQLVFRENITLAQEVHKSRFTHIGVTNKSHTHHLATILTLHTLLLVDIDKLTLQTGNLIKDNTLISLQLSLSWATHTNTTTLTLKVSPQTCKSRKHIFILSQLNLSLRVGSLRTTGENIKDKTCTVQNLNLQLLLYILELLGCQLIIKDNQANIILDNILLYLLQLSSPDKCDRVRII
ncbi:hypothetical protein EVA_12677 [gut metagenome]|uniref:Uncharacterized protein n=1 Tax=gut metagenome TaxID=749906 RepID=J9FW42_9ZZZZ